jgi:hypothetical protein
MQFFDLRSRSRIYYGADCFFESRVEGNRCRGGRGRLGLKELGSREEEFAIQLEDLVKFCRDVAAYDVLDTYAC